METLRNAIFLILVGLFTLPDAAAGENVAQCYLTSIQSAFKAYLKFVDQAHVTKIQTRLNLSGYGPIEEDGVLGQYTRQALQSLCLDYAVPYSDNFASQLIERLDMTAAVSKMHPDWRRTVKSDEFTAWRQQQPEPEQRRIRQVLQYGPADEGILIIDRFLVARLSALPGMASAVSKVYPDWREIIETDPFFAWVQRQPEQDQADIRQTLKTGPADKVIGILDRFFEARPAGEAPVSVENKVTAETASAKKATTEKAATEKAADEDTAGKLEEALSGPVAEEDSTEKLATALAEKLAEALAADRAEAKAEQQAAAEKAAAEKAAEEKAAEEKAAAEKAAEEQAAAEKIAEEEAAAEKAAADKCKASESLVEKKLDGKRSRKSSGELAYYRWQPNEALSNAAEACLDQTFPEVEKVLAGIEGVSYPTEVLFKQALSQLFAGSGLDYRQYEEKIITGSLTFPSANLPPLGVSGDSCGCSEAFSGTVYGFYPYWLAPEDDAALAGKLNLLDRIAYYAVTVDLSQPDSFVPLQWNKDAGVGNFIRVAERYRVKVDAVVRVTGWQKLSRSQLKQVSRKVVDIANLQFKSTDDGSVQKYLPFVGGEKMVSADGVTLYFDDYQSGDSMANVVEIVTDVTTALRKEQAERVVNVQLDVGLDAGGNSECKEGSSIQGSRACMDNAITGMLTQLKEIIVVDKDGDGMVDTLPAGKPSSTIDSLLLYLPEPTTNSKKTLRRLIEETKAYDGEVRDTLYSKVIPITKTPDSDGEIVQFEHDLVYFKRHFGGVGLWPLPLADNPVIDDIGKAFDLHYRDKESTGFVAGLVDDQAAAMCDVVCPNRWIFRIGFDLLAGLLLAYAVLAIWNCRLRKLYRKYALYFLLYGLVTAGIFLISLVCDPFWAQRIDSVMIAVILGMLLFIITRYVRKAVQPQLP